MNLDWQTDLQPEWQIDQPTKKPPRSPVGNTATPQPEPPVAQLT